MASSRTAGTVYVRPITRTEDRSEHAGWTPRGEKGRSELAVTQAGDLWTRCTGSLRDQVSENTWQLWLSGIEPVAYTDGEFVLSVPNGLIRERVESRYLPMIEDTLANEVGTPVRGRLEVQEPGPAVAPVEPTTEQVFGLPFEPEPRPEPAPAARGGRESPAVQLDTKFTFETFVSGPSNEFAHAVARRVASWTDGHFNPVVFHGPYGFGKTHLLNALAWEAMKTAPHRKVVYLTSERFLSSFIQAVMERRMGAFKDELRSADLLLIDDVHFIGGKHSTQEELFHTLAALMEDGRRVVFSADRPASALCELDARLRSHLSAGLVCGVEPADRTLRLGILERKLRMMGSRQGFPGALRPDVAASDIVTEFLAGTSPEASAVWV